MKCWLHCVTVVRRPMYMSTFYIYNITGMRASNVYVRYSTLTTSVDSSLDCRFCHRLSSRNVPVPFIAATAWFILVILLYWTCLVACSPSVLEHCYLGTRRAPLGSPKRVPSVHGASLHRHWSHGFAPLNLFASADILLYFWCMPEIP